jgi:two-component system, sensor histidine kinase and response regulator
MSQSRPRILLADDDEVTRSILATMIDRCGFGCETVSTGVDAAARALSASFAAVILDYEMPGLNGLEATLRIRRLEGQRKTPLIVLSSHTEKRERVLGAGANAYLVKPVTQGTLRATLASWTRTEEPSEPPTFAPMERDLDMIELFFELVPERLALMRESAGRQDLTAARAEAHRLIGSCAVLGFLRMAALARRVASGEIAPALGVEQLTTELQRVESELARSPP